MDPKVTKVVTITPAFTHPTEKSDDVPVAYTAPIARVPAMSRTQATMDKLGIDTTQMEVEEELKQYTPKMTIDSYISKFKSITNGKEMKALREEANAEESTLRKVYAKKSVLSDLPILKERYPLLIPVYDNEDIFPCKSLYPEEKSVPKVFPLGDKRKKSGISSIVDRKGFETNWRIFSERLLDLLDWNHVFVAGGSILACLLPPPPKATKNFKCLRKYFHEDVYAGSDIDLFIYGLNEEEGKNKLKEIYEAVCNEIPYSVLAFRSAYAISIVSQFPYRHIQIILRLYSSPSEILMGFDVDSCSCGYDGKQVYMTPRCHQALIRQMNTVDMSRRSPTYEMRLAKYADRGFEVEVPSLQRDHIDPMIFEKPWDDVRGLSKLLLLEKLRTPEARYAYRERSTTVHSVDNYKMRCMMNDPYLKKRLEYANEKASDYSTVFLPWGPTWTAKRIRKLMLTKDIMLNSEWSEVYNNRGYHTHPCFIGTLEEVIKDCCGSCPPIPPSVDKESLECFVSGPLSFIVDDPGRQSIGSFHPITDGDWSDGAYLSNESEQLIAAANRNDVDMIRAMITNGVKVDVCDALGRTALHMATINNHYESVKLLLSLGANPALHLKDGRNILHIAAEYGYCRLLELFISELQLTKTDKINEEVNEGMDIDELNKVTQLSALHYAVLFGHIDCVDFLLKNGASCTQMIWSSDKSTGVSILLLAAHCECFDAQVAIQLYQILHDHGASLKLVDKDYNNVMHMICEFNYPKFTQYLLQHDELAISLCNDINSQCMNPVAIAISKGFYSLAKLLIEAGAALHVTEKDLTALNTKRRKDRSQTRYGFYAHTIQNVTPPLFLVLNRGNLHDISYDFCKYLIDKGEDVNQTYNNETVLDVLLHNEPYFTYEELQEHKNMRYNNTEKRIAFIEEIMKKQPEGSYKSLALQYWIETEKKNHNQARKLQACEIQAWKERQEWFPKFYKLIDSHGGMMNKEINTLNNINGRKPSAPLANTMYQTTMIGHAFGGRPFNNNQSTDCITVVDNKVLRGQERLHALRQYEFDTLQKNQTYSFVLEEDFQIDGFNQFTIYINNSECTWNNTSCIHNAECEKYCMLYDAVLHNDLNTVKEVCKPNENGDCAFVLSRGMNDMSPLALATTIGNKDMIDLLFDIINKQYTPIPVVKKIKTDKMSNYALITNEDEKEEDVFIDPNSNASHIINSCNPSILFTDCSQFDVTTMKYKCLATSSYRCGSNDLINEETKKVYERTSLLGYLVYKGDTQLFQYILDHIYKLSNQVYEKEIQANMYEADEIKSKWIFNKLFTMELSYSDVNLTIACIMNDRIDMLRLLMKYNFCSLNVLRQEDVETVKKVVKHKLSSWKNNDYMDDDSEYDDYSDEESNVEDEEEKNESMEVENGNDGNDGDESAESEYVDSDEEEMKRMQQFKEDGNKNGTQRRVNAIQPVLIALRYNASHCLDYLLHLDLIKEDMKQLVELNATYAKDINEAGGIDEVAERVFGKEAILKNGRSLLQVIAMSNNVDLFKKYVKLMEDYGLNTNQLVKGSKEYPSLIEFAMRNNYLSIIPYLMQTYQFRTNEVKAAYSYLAYTLTNLSVPLEEVEEEPRRRMYGQPEQVKSNPVELYHTIMELIQSIPETYKEEILKEITQRIIKSDHVELTREIISTANVTISDTEDLLNTVVETLDDKMMMLLLDTFHIKEKLMREDPHGYTVVELIMTKYIKLATSKQAVQVTKSDDDAYMKHKIIDKEEAIRAKSKKDQARVDLYRLMKMEPHCVAPLLDLVIKQSKGCKRELTTLDEIQKRVKKDAEEITNSTKSTRRYAYNNYNVDGIDYKSNSTMQRLAQLSVKEINFCVYYIK